jgi:hypothetical protein
MSRKLDNNTKESWVASAAASGCNNDKRTCSRGIHTK